MTPRGSGLATAYGIVTGLIVAATLGWPYVLVFSLVVGSRVGWKIAGSARDAQSHQTSGGVT